MNRIHTKPHQWRVVTVFQLLVGLLLSLSALGQPAFLKDGLVAYYPFNGNANDESGNGYHLTPIGSPTYISDNIAGVSRTSVSMSGISDGFTLNKPLAGTVFTRYPITVSFWRKGLGSHTAVAVQSSDTALFGVGGNLNQNIIQTDQNRTVQNANDANPSRMFFNGKYSADVWIQTVFVLNEETSSAFVNGLLVAQANLKPLNTSLALGQTSQLYIGVDPFLAWDQYWNGQLDEIRIYNRALSDSEVKALYDHESAPPQNNLNPRIASATTQVVNGFVVGATITDGGYGYVSNPVVTITGGGGTGAKATATQFNGVVTSITITNPGSGYTSAPTITIAPPPFPPRKATATSQIINGFVVGTKITDGGFGYDTPPAVLVVGGGGSGATAVATVANGVVTAITITDPGTGYTSSPLIRIASPPFAPKLGIETSKVYVRMSVVLGRKYQLEASTDLNTWTSTGPSFIAQDEELVQEFDVNQVGRYFRINQVP